MSERGAYKEQIVTILSVEQDRIKKGKNRGRLFERYQVQEHEGKTFYNFHDHLLGEVQTPFRAKIAFYDDPQRPKVEKVVPLYEPEPNDSEQYQGQGLDPRDVLMGRMSVVKSSIQALQYVEGGPEEKLDFYRSLVRENDEYVFKGALPEPELEE